MQTSEHHATMTNTRPPMVRQISASSVAAFEDQTGQKRMQFPSSSSPQDMLQKMSNGQSSAVSISAASSSSSLSSCAFDMNTAAPTSAHDDERQRLIPNNNNKGEQTFIHEGSSEDCGESSSSRPLSSCLSFPANNTKLKRSVHFDEAVCIKTIPSLESYTDTEISSMYYSAEEEKTLKREKKAVVATLRVSRTGTTSSSMGGMMQTASPHCILDDEEEYCARGLENHLLSRECKRKKIAEALDVIYSVLMVQEDQHNNNYCDDVALAMASMTRSQAARMAALERAARDEAETKIAARNDFLDQTLAAGTAGAKKADKFLATTRTGLVPNARRNSSNARSSARASCA